MKLFIITDVHSYYDEMIAALKAKGYNKKNPNHVLISLGDLLDRGKKPIQCLKFINSIPKDNKILIRGNHEDLLEKFWDKDAPDNYDFSNGTTETACAIMDYCKGDKKITDYKQEMERARDCDLVKDYYDCLYEYAEIADYVFVHGWIPCEKDGNRLLPHASWRQADMKHWSHSRWVNGMLAWKGKIRDPEKTIYCGHWNCSWGWAHLTKGSGRSEWPDKNLPGWEECFEPWRNTGIVAMDSCVAYSGFVNCEVIELPGDRDKWFGKKVIKGDII